VGWSPAREEEDGDALGGLGQYSQDRGRDFRARVYQLNARNFTTLNRQYFRGRIRRVLAQSTSSVVKKMKQKIGQRSIGMKNQTKRKRNFKLARGCRKLCKQGSRSARNPKCSGTEDLLKILRLPRALHDEMTLLPSSPGRGTLRGF
jgi:hypothetical protein